MTQDQFNELKALIDKIGMQDVLLGQALSGLLFAVGTMESLQVAPVPPEEAPAGNSPA